MRIGDTSDLWWKTAVVYCLDVERYLDSDGDGIGDLQGLVARIDHLAELGVTCLWLMPFYPTPGRDDGYDIADHTGVDPRLGTLGDLVEVLRTAHDRGMRVIVDLVVNHTSDRHPWFRSARRGRSSRHRDFYIWRDEIPAGSPEPMLPGEEHSVWELDERSGQYYLHSFYRHQPDLDLGNPRVRRELAKAVGFWLQLGVDGFRVDAVPSVTSSPAGVDRGDPHEFLRDLVRFIRRRRGDAVLLGEVNLPYARQLEYFGGEHGGELDVQFDFPAMQALHLSLVRHDPAALVETLRSRPPIPIETGWAVFVRNHDELVLDQLADDEREEVFAAFAPDPAQRIYGRGITRRLPTMLDGDPRRIRLAYSLMFSLPGTPVLYYGEEIGLGENPSIEGRMSVRTPMQWTPDAKGGFSTAPASRWTAGFPDGGFGPRHVNARDQHGDPASLLEFMRTLIARHRAAPEIGWGELEVIEQDRPVLVHRLRADTGHLLFAHNFASTPQDVAIALDDGDAVEVVDLMTGRTVDRRDAEAIELALDPYGHRWLRVVPGDGDPHPGSL